MFRLFAIHEKSVGAAIDLFQFLRAEFQLERSRVERHLRVRDAPRDTSPSFHGTAACARRWKKNISSRTPTDARGIVVTVILVLDEDRPLRTVVQDEMVVGRLAVVYFHELRVRPAPSDTDPDLLP